MLIQLSNNAWVDPEKVVCINRHNILKYSVVLHGVGHSVISIADFSTPQVADSFMADTGQRINEYFERKNRTASVAGHMTQADHANNLTIADIMADLKAQPTPKEGE